MARATPAARPTERNSSSPSMGKVWAMFIEWSRIVINQTGCITLAKSRTSCKCLYFPGFPPTLPEYRRADQRQRGEGNANGGEYACRTPPEWVSEHPRQR